MKNYNLHFRFQICLMLFLTSVLTLGCLKIDEEPVVIVDRSETSSTVVASMTNGPSKTPEVIISSPTASSVPSPSPTSTSRLEREIAANTATPLPTFTTTPMPIIIESLEDIWPLKIGNYWVNLSINIDTGLSATYLMTDTVMSVQEAGNYYVVEMDRQAQLVYGDESVGFGESVKPGTYFYVVNEEADDVYVYLQRDFDLSVLDSAELAYVFPLELEKCWAFNLEMEDVFGGCDVVVKNIEDFHPLESGQLAKCFAVRASTFVGRGNSWFCPGIGIVENSFMLNSSSAEISAGYHELLIDYSFSKP